MKPGDHGSTFAGNPLVTRAAEAVVDIISGVHAGHKHSVQARLCPVDESPVREVAQFTNRRSLGRCNASQEACPRHMQQSPSPPCLCPCLITHTGMFASENFLTMKLHHARVAGCCAEPAFLESVVDKGERLRSSLQEALKGNEHVTEIRGLGLITGIQLDQVQCSPDSACRQSCWQTLIVGIDWHALVLSSATVSVDCLVHLVQS